MKKPLIHTCLGTALAFLLTSPAWSASFLDELKNQGLGGTRSDAAAQPSADSTAPSPLPAPGAGSQGGLGALGGAAGLGGLGAAGGLGGLGAAAGLGGLGLPAIGSGTASNAAGVLEYCLKNRYLGASGAKGVQDQLLGKLGLSNPAAQKQDSGFQQGLSGMLIGSDGKGFSLNGLQNQLKEKACDYVLDNASALL